MIYRNSSAEVATMNRQPVALNSNRRGGVLVLTAFLMIALMAMIAFAVDLGYLEVTKVELQRTADSAAIAGAWELVSPTSSASNNLSGQIGSARTKAVQFAALNPVQTMAPVVDTNTSNSTSGDIVVGYLSNPSDPSAPLNTQYPNQSNAVQVQVRKTLASANGGVPYFFARVLGLTSQDMQASATAALINNVGGFQTPSNGGNIQILPFALDKETWDNLLAGGGDDNWTWDSANKRVVSGSDGTREVNLYPQGTGSPGNRGTVDIGGSNNSTADIARQIVYGISPQDFQALGHPLTFNSDGNLFLNGDTGISAGVKDELASIIGQPRIIPIFQQVQGPGNNAMYTIVEFAGVRIVDVNLTGKMSSKRVIIQPAAITALGAIPGGATQTSWYINSPAWLVR
jgi:Flp pilus assembly protein TadG